MSYSEDFKKRTIEYLQEGHTYKETSKVYKISPNTLNAWVKRYREEGSLSRKYRSYARKIEKSAIMEYLKKHPDAYQSEIAEHFGCDSSTVSKSLKRMGITRKKRRNDTKNKIL